MTDSNPDNDELSGDVDHALLESLFYNEFALLETDDWASNLLNTQETTVPPPASRGIKHSVQPVAPITQLPAAATLPTASLPVPVVASGVVTGPTSTTRSTSTPTTGTNEATLSQPEDAGKRKVLVSQFATLAERLGITIPSEIIGKLQQPESPVEITEAGTKRSNNNSTTIPRRRKKPRLHECQVKLANLREENERLKRHLDVIQNRSQTLLKERAVTEDTMRNLMETGDYDQLPEIIDAYSETHSDYGKKRFEELQFHLDQLHRLSNPTDFTKMGLWALGGNGGKSNSSKPRISNLLQSELAITPAQSRKILEQREKIRTVCANHKECIALLNQLKTLCDTKTQIFNDRMTKVRKLLSPKQTVMLILWIKQNANTLSSVCPGWESEQKA